MNTEAYLGETEAAIFLGVTKELLFKYCRYAPKRNIGHARKLPFDRERGFSVAEMESWDSYLHEPWADAPEPRPAIPTYIEDHLKIECGGRCALCGLGHKLENAHINPWASSLSHHHLNLIRICTACHEMYDDGLIAMSELRTAKDRLVKQSALQIRHNQVAFTRGNCFAVPVAEEHFFGREETVKEVRSRLRSQRLVVIEGLGGIGKTQLLIQALDNFADLPTIWLDVGSYSTIVEIQTAFVMAVERVLKVSVRMDTVYDVLRNAAVRCIFDGFESLSCADSSPLDLVADLVRLTNTPQIVVTTQIGHTRFQDKSITVTALSTSDSSKLLAEMNSCRLSEGETAWIADFCSGHALSLRLVCTLLSYFGDPTVVIQRLQSAGTDALLDKDRSADAPHASLNSCLAAIYSIFTQSQRQRLLFASVFPAGCWVEQLKIGQRSIEDTFDVEVDVAELKRLFFIEIKDRMVHMLSPVRQYVQLRWREDNQAHAWAIVADAAVFLGMRLLVIDAREDDLEKTAVSFQIVDFELQNILYVTRFVLAILKQTPDESTSKRCQQALRAITGGVSRYMFVRGYFELGISFAELGIDVRMQQGDIESAADQYMFLIRQQLRSHDDDGLNKSVSALADLAKKSASDGVAALASIARADLESRNGNHNLAVPHLRHARRYFQERLSGNFADTDANRYASGMLAMTSMDLGRLHELNNEYDEALVLHTEALTCLKLIHSIENIGSAMFHVGNCHGALGDYSQAIDMYVNSADYFLKCRQHQFLSNSLGEIGELLGLGASPAQVCAWLDDEIVNAGLEDIIFELRNFFDGGKGNSADGFALARKMFGVIKLISFTDYRPLLRGWLDTAYSNILKPGTRALMELNGGDIPRHQVPFLFHLQLIVEVVARLASWDNDKIDRKSLVSDLNELCDDLALAPEAVKAFKSHQWLSEWLGNVGFMP